MAFIAIRKKTVIIILSIVLAAVVIAATAATVVVATRTDNGITIVIDAGHGGADGGVTGVSTGTKESDVNLAIAKYLEKHLEKAGYNVVMTRSDGGAVCGGLKYSKREDMKARKETVNSAAPDLVISIHCNSYPVESVKGAQVFFASARGQGETFANTVQSYFNDVLNERDRNAMIGDYYILNCTEYPSI
ncbi:MAG: N-acetylmuramoyl-L-alanine amidase, partial [Clostridiales bacterium]|nr:N-acetylmuramoyl-L-alanine amidase [Clostridiales bacterium]